VVPQETPKSPNEKAQPRAWKGVLFHCCGVYGRIYKSVVTGMFEGHCPRCGKPAKADLLSWLLCCILSFGLLCAPQVCAQSLDAVSVPDTSVLVKKDLHAGLVPLDSMGKPKEKAVNAAMDSLARKNKVEALKPDSTRLAIFVQTGVAFLGFSDRTRFENALDTVYADYMSKALTLKDSANVKRQLFQKVNFCFPAYAGISLMLSENQHVAAGLGYIYDREAVVITDKASNPNEFFYVIQAMPLFLEWRVGISPRLISLDNAPRFSASFRYYWLLAGTEVYSNSGDIKSKPELLGNGWSFSLGYQLLEWKRIRLFGDLGVSSITANSNSAWTPVVINSVGTSTPEHASWDLGGFELGLRAEFGVLKRK